MTRTDIPNPTALDEAFWTFYVALRADSGARLRDWRWHVAHAACTLFPQRAARLAVERYKSKNPERLRDYKAAQRRARGARPRSGPSLAWTTGTDECRAYYRDRKRVERSRRRDEINATKREWYARSRDRINAARRADRKAVSA